MSIKVLQCRSLSRESAEILIPKSAEIRHQRSTTLRQSFKLSKRAKQAIFSSSFPASISHSLRLSSTLPNYILERSFSGRRRRWRWRRSANPLVQSFQSIGPKDQNKRDKKFSQKWFFCFLFASPFVKWHKNNNSFVAHKPLTKWL